jgi:hypothetical protein
MPIAVLAWALALCAGACSQQPKEPAEAPPAAPEAPAAAPAPAAAAAPHDHADMAAAAATMELPPVPAGAKVFFVEPAEGAKIVGPLENGKVTVAVKMGAEGIAIKPAGAVEAGSGHHHVLIDVPEGVAQGAIVPKDEQHLHFGQAQTEAKVALAPGDHTLTLQLADGIHRSYGPALSASVKLSVAAAGSVAAAATATK